MGTFRERRVVSRCVVCAVLVSACAKAQTSPSPWPAAVAERMRFEGQPSHARSEYARVMDGFRAIYHADPQDVHAPAAILQVAELLAEQGRELGDAKSVSNAAGQCSFLAKSYPASTAARTCKDHVEAIAKSPDRVDRAAAPAVAREAIATTPRSLQTDSAMKVGDPVSLPPTPVAAEKNVRTARVTGIRHWSTPSYTRVAIDLGDEIQYEAARVEHPDRIFFDLHHAHLAPELVGKTFAVTDDGFLSKIRAAQYSDDVTRVVLDVHEISEYSAFLLPNPYRLIIDIHGKAPAAQDAANSEQRTGNSKRGVSGAPRAAASPEKSAAEIVPELARPQRNADLGASQLPPHALPMGAPVLVCPQRLPTRQRQSRWPRLES